MYRVKVTYAGFTAYSGSSTSTDLPRLVENARIIMNYVPNLVVTVEECDGIEMNDVGSPIPTWEAIE